MANTTDPKPLEQAPAKRGRKPTADGQRALLASGEAHQLNVVIPTALWKQLKIRAVEMSRSMADLTTEALARYLADAQEGHGLDSRKP